MSIPLIPVPNHLENRGGAAFALSGETKIFADPDSQAAVELFTQPGARRGSIWR